MAGWLAKPNAQPQPKPVRLELSGERLEASLARLTAGCEPHGGIERYVQAVKLKSTMFRDALGASGEHAGTLEPEAFKGLCTFMATVRRRIAPWLERPDFDALRDARMLQRLVGELGPSLAQRIELLPRGGQSQLGAHGALHVEAGLGAEPFGRHLASGRQQMSVKVARVAVRARRVHREVHRHVVAVRDLPGKCSRQRHALGGRQLRRQGHHVLAGHTRVALMLRALRGVP